MALNIVAHRRVSLKGFAEGWDDCYLKVRAMNQDKLDQIRSAVVDSDSSEEEKANVLRDIAKEIIEGGQVVNTKDDGSTELVQLEKSDVSYVVGMLGFGWLQEVMMVASGTDRLKVLK